jgi:hypothetical protein
MVVMHRIGGESDASMGGFPGGAKTGVMTSPSFGQPTSASVPRRIEIDARFGF